MINTYQRKMSESIDLFLPKSGLDRASTSGTFCRGKQKHDPHSQKKHLLAVAVA